MVREDGSLPPMQTDSAERIPEPRSHMPSIRRATNADRDQVVQLHQEGLSEVGVDHDSNLDSDLEDLDGCYTSRGGEFLVFEDSGKVIAMGAYRKLDNKSVELRRFRVARVYRRQGYGRRLLRALADQAKIQGFKQMVLDVNDGMYAACALFELQGFELERTTEFFGVILHFYRKLL